MSYVIQYHIISYHIIRELKNWRYSLSTEMSLKDWKDDSEDEDFFFYRISICWCFQYFMRFENAQRHCALRKMKSVGANWSSSRKAVTSFPLSVGEREKWIWEYSTVKRYEWDTVRRIRLRLWLSDYDCHCDRRRERRLIDTTLYYIDNIEIAHERFKSSFLILDSLIHWFFIPLL